MIGVEGGIEQQQQEEEEQEVEQTVR